MELKRRTFLRACAGAAAAAVLWPMRDMPARCVEAVRAWRYPGPLRAREDKRREGGWAG